MAVQCSGFRMERIGAMFRAKHPDLPWKLIAGTRDKLIHLYQELDLDEVWKMVTSDLPELICLIEPLAPDRP